MVIKTIQMISNTYGSERQGLNEVLGEYCVFGPFDAMHIDEQSVPWNYGLEQRGDLEAEGNAILSCYDGQSNRCNIPCVFSKKEKDKEDEFVNRMKEYPFLFVSFLLLKHNKEEKVFELTKSTVKVLNGRCDTRVYLSLGKNELILLHYCENFTNGLDTVLHQHKFFSLSKASTIFAVQEQALDTESLLYQKIDKEEKISCRLRCSVKDYAAADAFWDKLCLFIRKKSNGQTYIKRYNAIGSNDILIEIDNFTFCELLPLYKTGRLLTHMNPEYSSAWFNIETELICERKGGAYGSGDEWRSLEIEGTESAV